MGTTWLMCVVVLGAVLDLVSRCWLVGRWVCCAVGVWVLVVGAGCVGRPVAGLGAPLVL